MTSVGILDLKFKREGCAGAIDWRVICIQKVFKLFSVWVLIQERAARGEREMTERHPRSNTQETGPGRDTCQGAGETVVREANAQIT